ncbi:urea ABC transporter permease subunit UrtC [Paenibacillus validus]|uniref:Urea ABC transporter permease subunit UrtC n=1 Tax=Paenibacillus validus TaxID=44253 RepID=A0A7X3CS12_9BACL|nr:MULTISPECIES: urea ABC transporter permease subunit UrtC [Paenibacillus]MED4601298.1 urea ABC transporter permease subunit UrtC [Paenibacillus validus]MED4605961.1 urea ABC transporter permease subunit UrtC [Paenibacillus validus]MUG71305.1 urea ABC transporter permease subunit UrtC [Paenibacillus validus]
MPTNKFGLNHTFAALTLVFLVVFPLFASEFRVELMGKFIVFILFAFSLNLIWGYTGLLSLGHAVFFGLGGYMLALAYSLQKGIPSFMSRFNITEIPLVMKPLQSIPMALILGLALPAVLAALIGFFVFKSRVSGVYFSIITLALAKLFEMLVINLQAYTGGFNGLMGLPRFPINGEPLSLTSYYYVVLAVTVLAFFFTRWLAQSHFGKVIKSIREDESRIRFLSYNPANYKIFIFTVSGLLAGLAGMLYVPMNGFISPQDTGIAMSTGLVIWLAIGGRGTLMGPIVGVFVVNWLSNLLSEQYPTLWQLILGAVMVLIVLFLPNGIYGTLENWWNDRSLRKKSATVEEPLLYGKGEVL